MTSSEPSASMVVPGDVLAGKYKVERAIGRGGMGIVVAARHTQLGTRVAIKCLLPSVVGNRDMVARFLREAQTASLIASEHVTRVLDMGTLASGCPFIVMEYLEGRDLAAVLRERGQLAVTEAVDCALQACEALAVAHAAGIVHRDLKPANLFLTQTPDGAPHIKILDFGISKKQESQGEFTLTRTGAAIMGSPAYISPEQIRSQKRVDGRADIWSLGVSLFELLSGQLPFMAEDLGGLIAAILADPPVALRSIRPDLPPALEAVVNGCLEKSVAARPANVAVLAQQLRPFASARGMGSIERTMGVVARTTGNLSGVQGAPIADAPRAEMKSIPEVQPAPTRQPSAPEFPLPEPPRPITASAPSAWSGVTSTVVQASPSRETPAIPAQNASSSTPPPVAAPHVAPAPMASPPIAPAAANAAPPIAPAPAHLPVNGTLPIGTPVPIQALRPTASEAQTTVARGLPSRSNAKWIVLGSVGLLGLVGIGVALGLRGSPDASGGTAPAGSQEMPKIQGDSAYETPPVAAPTSSASAEPEPSAAPTSAGSASTAAPTSPPSASSGASAPTPVPIAKPPVTAKPRTSGTSDLNKLIQKRK